MPSLLLDKDVKTASDNEQRYRLSPDLALESFGEKAVILLAMQDHWITINNAAAVLMKRMMRAFGKRSFSHKQLADLLFRCFDLSTAQALKESRSVITQWLGKGILTKKSLFERMRGTQ